MTKDEQLKHLVSALNEIAFSGDPLTGEDALNFRDGAEEALSIWANRKIIHGSRDYSDSWRSRSGN